MNPTNANATAQTAELRVRMAVEQVNATEKKARAAKEKVWRAKLLFKLARRASKRAKKAAKHARAKAVQAQIALKELNEQIVPATQLSVRTKQTAPTPGRNAPNQSSPAAAAESKHPAGASKVGVEPLRASARQRPAQTRSAVKPMKSKAAERAAKRRPQAVEAAGQAGHEPVSAARRALDESKEPTGSGNFGEERIRYVQPSPESPPENTGS